VQNARYVVCDRGDERNANTIEKLILAEIPVYPFGPIANKSLRQSRIRTKTGAMVVGVLNNETFRLAHDPDLVLERNSVAAVIGNPEQIKRVSDLALGPYRPARHSTGLLITSGYGDVGSTVYERLKSEGHDCLVMFEARSYRKEDTRY